MIISNCVELFVFISRIFKTSFHVNLLLLFKFSVVYKAPKYNDCGIFFFNILKVLLILLQAIYKFNIFGKLKCAGRQISNLKVDTFRRSNDRKHIGNKHMR
jgi:hypothetical protein